MPKYVKTIVRKTTLVPWVTNLLETENVDFLIQEERVLRQNAINEVQNFSGFINHNVQTIGNTQIVSWEFDTIENVRNFITKTQKPTEEGFDSELYLSKFNLMVRKRITDLGLAEAYTVSDSIES
jgi:hypothetical protein